MSGMKLHRTDGHLHLQVGDMSCQIVVRTSAIEDVSSSKAQKGDFKELVLPGVL